MDRVALNPDEPAQHNFQVDLRGVVDLLARHLYSSPRVFLRELMQNGIDAITARREFDPGVTGRIEIRPDGKGGLEVLDTGVGLTLAEADELLATIGRSSKRDLELGTGREQFLGQFGIGLLSAFLVADELEVYSRSAREPGAPAIRWSGRADGTYSLTTVSDAPLAECGSLVRLRARVDAAHWVEPATILALAGDFGSLLPVDVTVVYPDDQGTSGDAAGGAAGLAHKRITRPELPWLQEYSTPGARQAALTTYCQQTLGFQPLATIDLSVPVAGLTGVAYVLPSQVAPGNHGAHRVYLKRMLLGTRIDDLLPEWAFFVRCIVDTSGLRPTANRESIYEDEMLLATREALGEQIRAWLVATLSDGTALSKQFIATHHLAVRSLALSDDTMLDLAGKVLPFETTDGTTTLAQFISEHDNVSYTADVEDFRRSAAVAHAQGLAVVNGGYVYDADLLARYAAHFPEAGLSVLSSGDVEQVLSDPDPVQELELLDGLGVATEALARWDTVAVLKKFEPDTLAALLLHDREAEFARNLRDTIDGRSDLWSGVLSNFGVSNSGQRRLMLNAANSAVCEVLASPDREVVQSAVRALYVTAVLASGQGLGPGEADALSNALSELVRKAARPGP